jgi:uncharacterized protein (DUF1501 family)
MAGSAIGLMTPWNKALALTPVFTDYRALVCIYLFGGNDSANMVVPRDAGSYNQYQSIRGDLAVPQGQLLAIQSTSSQRSSYGLHPSLEPLHSLYKNGELALVANVGTLLEPVSRQTILEGNVFLPPQLFSHSDQTFQWQTGISDTQEPIGWGGRMADLLPVPLSLLPMNITLAGQSVFLNGRQTIQYALDKDGPEGLEALDGGDGPLDLAVRQLLGGSSANLLERQFMQVQNRSIDLHALISSELVRQDTLSTSFPDTDLGKQLSMVTRMIASKNALGGAGLNRQVFLVGMDGWDTHDNQNDDQPRLLGELAAAMRAFREGLAEIGELNNVTGFTASEFGRTLTNNGDGTDHGWGGHQLVMGGAVNGNDIFGVMPDLSLDGPDDAGDGRLIPGLSTDQYAATLARWFGVPESDLGTLFPHLHRFSRADLGFMQG